MEVFTEDYIRKTYSSKTKTSLITSIINAYCSCTYLNRNLWMLQKIVDMLKEIEAASHKPQEIITLLCKLISYINQNEQREFVPPKENIQHMLYSAFSSNEDIAYMSKYVTDDIYTLLSILYISIKHADVHDLSSSLAIVRHVLKTPSKTKELDSHDCMFVFILQLLQDFHFDEDIVKYVTCCKDIFYYRLRKKDKPERENLIYFGVYVMISRKVVTKALSSLSKNSLLYIVPRVDPTARSNIEQMKSLHTHYHERNMEKKVIDTLDKQHDFEVIKR